LKEHHWFLISSSIPTTYWIFSGFITILSRLTFFIIRTIAII